MRRQISYISTQLYWAVADLGAGEPRLEVVEAWCEPLADLRALGKVAHHEHRLAVAGGGGGAVRA